MTDSTDPRPNRRRRHLSKYRVIQWGTGSVGKHALRTIIEHPEYELAGVRVYNPDKVGVDAGSLVGGHQTGVLATDSREDILAIDADAVCYNALGSTLGDADEPVDDICRILASGKNVLSSAVEFHAYLREDRPLPRAGTDAYNRIRAACEEGGTSFFHAGINPGYTMELWPMTLAQLSRRIDRVTCTEVIDMTRYSSPHMLQAIGFGVGHDESPMDAHFRSSIRDSPFAMGMEVLTEALHIELDDIRYTWDTAPTKVPLEVAGGTIAAGTSAAIKFGLQGIVGDEPKVVFEWIWRVSNDVAPEWPIGDSVWLAHFEGDPTIKSELDVSTTMDARRAVSLTVATVLLNALPQVCEAAPGLYNNLTIGVHGGGYLG